jgi:membrane protease subunit (stomatin/prohibitin family)
MGRRFINQAVGAVLLLVVATAMQGCAFGTRNIALRYEPTVQVQAGANETVAVVQFKDARQEQKLGEARNAYGMKTATVKAEGQDVGAWVANALADELMRAGLDVQKFSDVAPPNIRIAIQGTVLEAYVKMYMSYRTTVRVQVTMEKDGIPVLNKEYTGKASGLAVMASSGSYEKQLNQALQDMMKQLVPDVLAAI